MKDCFWTTLFLLAVMRSAVAFKIPGLSGGGGGGSGRSPSGGVKPAASGGGNVYKDNGEYLGPVFIIRELNKEKGEYDAFITTGGIQEVRPPHAQQQQPNPYGPQQQHQQQQHQQMMYQMNPQLQVAPQPDSAKDDAEDSEYFGVLITPETVRTLNYPKSTSLNVSLPVLLMASSSRMPWLLVLHRQDYPTFEYQQQQPQHGHQKQQPQQQQQQPQQQQQQQQQSAAGAIPGGMQIPQRRRHYMTPPLDRQRRGLNARPDSGSDGPVWDDKEEYVLTGDDAPDERVLPLMFERQLMATMCYNFERENAEESATGTPRNWASDSVVKMKTKISYWPKEDADASHYPFWTPRDVNEGHINAELNRRFTRIIPDATEVYKKEELNLIYPKRVLPQTTEKAYTDEELNRMFPIRVAPQTSEKDYTDEELNQMFPKRVAPQTTEKDYTDEELNRMFPKRVAPQPSARTTFMEEVRNQLLTGIVTQATAEAAKKDEGPAEETNQNNVSSQTTERTDTEDEQTKKLIRVEQANRAFSKRVESQPPTTKPLTAEEAQAADKVFTRHDS